MALVLGALASLEVSPDVCLDRTQIEARLEQLAPRSLRAQRAVVSGESDGIHVTLYGVEGTLVASRVIARRPQCDQTTELVAVTLLSWDMTVGTPSDVPVALPEPAIPSPSPAPAPVPVVVSVATPPLGPHFVWKVGAAVLGSVSGGRFAAGGAAEVRLGRSTFPLGLRLGAAGLATRGLALGSGHASWGRAAAMISPTVDALSRVVQIDLHADALLGGLYLRGHGFASNYAVNAFDAALGAGVRGTLRRWSAQPWIDVSVLGWLPHQDVTAMVSGTRVSSEIPRLDVWFRLGLAYGRVR